MKHLLIGSLTTAVASFLLYICIAAMTDTSQAAQVDLSYKDRGNRNEGKKSLPVSSPPDIELVSAMVDYKEEPTKMPTQFKLKLFLDRQANVFIVVRELNYVHYYWLDNVRPRKHWAAGFDNDFAWPTSDVIQHIKGLEMGDLGVVARLHQSEPSKIERVAPVLFYYSQLPQRVTGYVFHFKTTRDASWDCRIYKDEEPKPAFHNTTRRVPGRLAFPIAWEPKNLVDGQYRLVITGFFLDNNDPINQEILFNHRSAVKP